MTRVWTRNKRKPPKDAHCDFHTGVGEGHVPTVIRCPNAATTSLRGGLFDETWACDACAAKLVDEPEETPNDRP